MLYFVKENFFHLLKHWSHPFLTPRGETIGLFLASLLLINVLCQGFTTKALNDFSEWDHLQIFYCFEDQRFGKELGSETFTMYGPALAHTLPYQSQNSPGLPWGMWAVLSFHLTCFLIWCRRIPGKGWPWFFVLLFGLFNVPSLKYAPFILLVWSLARQKDEKEWSAFSLSGPLYVAWLFLFKSSWGIIGLLHLVFDAAIRNQGIKNRTLGVTIRSGVFLFSSLLFYLLITERGTLLTYVDYWVYAIEDTRHYPSYNGSPLKLHYISSAWTNWQQFFHGNLFGETFAKNLLSLFPIISAIGALLLFWPGRKNPSLLIALPILFGEYKHSYVRADVTNLHGIFYLIPCAVLVVLISNWPSLKLRKILGIGLLTWVAMVILGFFPYNTPYRHPRHVWLGNIWESLQQQEHLKAESETALMDHLKTYEPIRESVRGQTVLSLPARNELSLMGQPMILPSNQPYFAMEGMARSLRDLEQFDASPPEIIIFEDKAHYFRPGGFQEFPSLLERCLMDYEAKASHDDFQILSRAGQGLTKETKKIFDGNWNLSSDSLGIDLTGKSLIFLRWKDEQKLREKIITTLLKSPRFELSIYKGKENLRSIQVGSIELREGVALYGSIRDLFTPEGSGKIKLEIKPSYQNYEYEISDDLHGYFENIDVRVELWSYR